MKKLQRSAVYSTNGMVASSQPLASEIGMRILQKGGNAADAAVAVAAALNVTEPCSTGIGGDCFALFYDSKTKQVKGLNASGKSPALLSLELLEKKQTNSNTIDWGIVDPLTVTVPGAAAGWVDCVDSFGSGKLSMVDILQPAIDLARNGFALAPMTAHHWAAGANQLAERMQNTDFMPHGKAPKIGEIVKLKDLALTFEEIAKHGKKGFYEGRVAQSIVDSLKELGGVISLEDLKNHQSLFVTPIKTNYRGYDIHEIPPNGQGITALIALNILEGFDISSYEYHSPAHLHLLIESMRLAFADARQYVACPELSPAPLQLISKEYAKERRMLIDHKTQIAAKDLKYGNPIQYSETVYFNVVDKEGNACSFINSNYMGFGTGIVPKGCGFTLQNRGYNFTLDKGHPNSLAPNKRPYHTIIPGMVTKDGELYCPFGVMGGFMQPQGHLQVISNMIDFGMNPQESLDSPRFLLHDGTANSIIYLEEGISLETIAQLKNFGHNVNLEPVKGINRSMFGRGQIIVRNSYGVLCGGCDPRSDGIVIGY